MKKAIIAYLVLTIVSGSILAQDNTTGSMELEDPGIILPAVIMEIDDLSIEKVDAGLPEGSDILLPEKELFIPEEITLSVVEPNFSLDLAGSSMTTGTTGGDGSTTGSGILVPAGSIIAEGMLGAGTAGSIVSRVSFYKSGDLPRFKFLFNHEMMDGYDARPAGIGYNSRYDELNASVLLDLFKMELEAALSFKDNEQGLQGQGDYYSVIDRFIASRNTIKYKISDIFILSGILGAELTSLLLTASEAPTYALNYPPTEMLLNPEITGTFNLTSLDIGLTAYYKYRTVLGSTLYDFHRFLARLDISFDSTFWIAVAGDVAFFRSNTIPMLFPFQLSFSGSPSRAFSFALRGGYRLEENDFNNLFTEFSFLDIPAGLADNHGWFGDLTLVLNLAESGFGISAHAAVDWNSVIYTPGAIANPQIALLGLNTYPDILTSDITGGVAWNSGEIISLEFSYRNLTLWRTAGIISEHDLKFSGNFTTSNDILGSRVEAVMSAGTEKMPAFPVLNANIFYKVLGNINLILEAKDILNPLLVTERFIAAPYITPGATVVLKIEINL